jgi:hypothetical protein
MTEQHQRRERDRDKLKDQNKGYTAKKTEEQDIAEETDKTSH